MTLPENWKKGVVGIITASAAFVDFDPSLFGGHKWLMSLSKFIMIGGFAALGLVPSRPKNGNGVKPPNGSVTPPK